MRTPTDACEGWSIRDTLMAYIQDIQSELKRAKGKHKARLRGQHDALAYVVAMIDNPYAPSVEAVKMETERVE